MDTDRSLRQRLQSTVLEASTPAGKTYNAVIFGAILLSVLALLEPDPWAIQPCAKPMCPGSIWFRTFVWRCLRRISFFIWPWWRSLAATCSASPD